jgi:hypothetical protein
MSRWTVKEQHGGYYPERERGNLPRQVPKRLNVTTGNQRDHCLVGNIGIGAPGRSLSMSDPYLYHDERLLRHGFFVAWA